MCKVQWSHHSEEEATWEIEDELMAEFLQLFPNLSESRGRDSLQGGRICNTQKFHHLKNASNKN
jgi:hypothetical protein